MVNGIFATISSQLYFNVEMLELLDVPPAIPGWGRLILIPVQHLAAACGILKSPSCSPQSPTEEENIPQGNHPPGWDGAAPEENHPGSHKYLLKRTQCYLCPLGSGVQGQIKVT